MGKQIKLLEHHAHLLTVQIQIGLGSGQILAIENDFAAVGLF
jgi:hypothetical protein